MTLDNLNVEGLETVVGAAHFLSITPTKIRTLITRKELPSVKIGRDLRIPRKALVKYCDELLAAQQDGRE